jgi:hypothetical protein
MHASNLSTSSGTAFAIVMNRSYRRLLWRILWRLRRLSSEYSQPQGSFESTFLTKIVPTANAEASITSVAYAIPTAVNSDIPVADGDEEDDSCDL